MNNGKVINRFNFLNINKKGMAMLEALIAFGVIFTFVAVLMSIGFYLRCESMVIGATKKITRDIEITGKMTQQNANDMEAKLNGFGIQNSRYRIITNSGDNVYTAYSSTPEMELPFRGDFKVVTRATYRYKIIDLPLIFVSEGKVERFKY
jgi:hypothetical protein